MTEVEILANNFEKPWAKKNLNDFDSWHSMCSYLGAFPPGLARYFIEGFSERNDWVMDPFAGRGTTSLEANLLQRRSIATDLNPIALTLSLAKSREINIEDVLSRIDDLERRFDSSLYLQEALSQPDNIHLIFHLKTLTQLCYIRRKILNNRNPVDAFLSGVSLGVLHGGIRSDGTSGYASIDMPNTFSMSPNYVKKFVQTNSLEKKFHNVFTILREKTVRLYKKHNPLYYDGIVQKADAKKIGEIDQLKQYHGKVKLILTSPPYLGIVNYAKQNWIRSWFLNEDPDNVSADLDDDLNLEEWINFSQEVIIQLKKFLSKDGMAVFVIGDVAKSKTSVIPLAREFALMIKDCNIFKNVWCISDEISDVYKTTKIWAETKGNATTTDRIVFLSDVNPFLNSSQNFRDKKISHEMVEHSTKCFLG